MEDAILELKGSAIQGHIDFVRDTFGEDKLKQWVAALSPEAREIVEGAVLQSKWYKGEHIVVELRAKICQLFYGGSPRGVWEFGRYSADTGLKGVYKVFLKVGSPGWIAERSALIFSQYHKPGDLQAVSSGKNLTVLQLTDFPERTGLVEQTIAGFIERAVELSGGRDVVVDLTKSFSQGHEYTEFRVSWK